MPKKPNTQTPLPEWLSYLENCHFKNIDLGLERVKSVAEKLDLLIPAPLVITVGGTNGKGTTCRLLETILINAGLRVGVYSSPHLLRYNERIRIQNQELTDEEHVKAFDFIERQRDVSLTYFEFSTLSALYLFTHANLDVVILEVGLGGRLDATNIVDSYLSVITSIDIDHVDFLGDNREKIAFEKAGIFRPNKSVIIGEPNIPSSMLEQAQKLNCDLFCRERDWKFSQQNKEWSWETLSSSLPIKYSNLPYCSIPLENAATALAVIEKLPFSISKTIIYQSLQDVELVGRFQYLKPEKLIPLAKKINKTVEQLPQIIIDVGHNPHAARYLATKLRNLSNSGRKIYGICGILQDKDAQGIFCPLLPFIDYWYCIPLTGPRGQNGEQLFVTLQQTAYSQNMKVQAQATKNLEQALTHALEQITSNEILLIFGSFHTVSDFLKLLQS